MGEPNLIGKLRAGLPAPARTLLDRLLSLADTRRLPVYLVGGPLRDLLLGRRSLDLDIGVEGDAIALARAFAEAAGARAVTHARFGTATVRFEDFHLDLISARSETYDRPGVLPTVKPATIHDDLLRRDFTINALALRLTSVYAGSILDPAGGRRDLDAHLVRVLQERSFQDDATRIVRAVRYATRFDFVIEPDTLACLKRDLACLETISGARLHHEFVRIFAEDTPEHILRRLHELGALAAIYPAFRFESEQAAAFARLRDLTSNAARAVYWPVLTRNLIEPQAFELARRLAATAPQREAMASMPALKRLEPKLGRPALKRSAIADLLARFPVPALWAFAALTTDPAVRERLLDYLTKARYARPHLTGDHLLALGVPQGPQLGEILRRLSTAHLDGEITTRKDEEGLARQLTVRGDKGRRHAKKVAPSRSS